jgi:hypothetical protein
MIQLENISEASWNNFNRSHFSICIHVYMVFGTIPGMQEGDKGE